MSIREIIGRLAAWRRRDEFDRNLAADLEMHTGLLARDFERDGLSPAQARAAARRQIGNATVLREESRRAWGFPAFDTVAQDVRVALRGLNRSRVFAATIILTIALGIGAATATFTIVDGVLLKDPPYSEPDRLVSIYTVFPHFRENAATAQNWDKLRTPYPDYVRYREAQRSLTDVAAINVGAGSVALGDATISVPSAEASANLLTTLGVSVAVGRWFAPAEEGLGSPRIAVLSNAFWQSRYGGDDNAIGRLLTLDGQPYEIVGVLPPSFAVAARPTTMAKDVYPEIWTPIGSSGRGFEPGNHTLELIGRLAPGMTIETASAEAEPLLRGEANPERRQSRMIPRLEAEVGSYRRPLWLLFGAVAVFLAITSGNVMSLFLGECAVRAPEFRTRSVLGAGRARLVRLVVTQSTVFATMGALLGVAFAWAGTRAILSFAPSTLPHASQIGIDVRVLAFTTVVALLIALVAAIGPVLMVVRDNAAVSAMAGARVIAGRSRLQLMAIGIQAAGAVVLLVGAGLLGRTLFNESTVDPGFTAKNSFQMHVTIPPSLAPTGADRRRINGDVERILANLPSVTGVTAMSSPPLSGRTNGQFVRPVPADPNRGGLNVGHAVVWHNYFGAMHIRILAGRSFSHADTVGSEPVAIVSEEMARVMWTPETAVGHQFHHPNGDVTVVGVAADVRNKELTKKAEPLFYLPAGQTSARNLSFIVSTSAPPLSVMTAAQRAVWDVMPSVTLAEVATFDALLDRALAPSRYRALLATIFAVLAVTMTVVGVAGLAARAIASRKSELCIRMALGATTGGVRMLAIRAPLGAVLLGVLAGTIVAAATSRWLSAYLFEVGATNGVTYGATLVFVASVSAFAAFTATRRLGRADLISALKET